MHKYNKLASSNCSGLIGLFWVILLYDTSLMPGGTGKETLEFSSSGSGCGFKALTKNTVKPETKFKQRNVPIR